MNTETTETPVDVDALDAFTRSYIEAALWSSSIGPGYDCPEDTSFNSAGYEESDIAPATLRQMVTDCADFQAAQRQVYADAWTDEQAGHDFWLTRNRHGAGFWDRGHGALGQALTVKAHEFGEADLYLGDDGLIHQG